MKNILFNLIIGAVIALAIFSSVTTISYLREDKVVLATTCPDTFQECQYALDNGAANCFRMTGDASEGCCIRIPNTTCNNPDWNNCQSACW
ncbi:MAG: hypothetical protein L6Q47_15360 [Ignavibacteriaceae bacterium]|nr:hypothetical protein [Ignavibacteriaceae bacterium]